MGFCLHKVNDIHPMRSSELNGPTLYGVKARVEIPAHDPPVSITTFMRSANSDEYEIKVAQHFQRLSSLAMFIPPTAAKVQYTAFALVRAPIFLEERKPLRGGGTHPDSHSKCAYQAAFANATTEIDFDWTSEDKPISPGYRALPYYKFGYINHGTLITEHRKPAEMKKGGDKGWVIRASHPPLKHFIQGHAHIYQHSAGNHGE